MLRFDKATYLSLSFKFIFSVRFSNYMRVRCFTIPRIHKYSIYLYIIPLLNSLYCSILFLVISFVQDRNFSDFIK